MEKPNPTSQNEPKNHTDGNLFKETEVVKRYEEFLVTNVEGEVVKNFDKAFDYINKKIFFPEYLWAIECAPPQINIIDFGIGAGKFTLPYVKKLESTIRKYSNKIPKIKVFGVDNSHSMLIKFNKHKVNLEIETKQNIIIKLCQRDVNKHSKIKNTLKKFMPEVYESKQTNRTINIILFAQTIHYLEEPKNFFDNVIASMNSCYILHFLPILYLKYMDGNFSTDDEAWDTYQTWDEKREDEEKANFNKERQALHKRFWRYFFALRDGYRNYSDQLITATNEDECFKWYKEKGLYKISENIASIWDKKITFDDLLGLIEKPIFSAHSIGLREESTKENIKNKIVDEFKKEIEKEENKNLFSTKVPFGYRFSLYYYNKENNGSSYIIPELNELEAKKNNHDLKVINSELMQGIIKSKFQDLILFFFGITYVNKFEFKNYKPIEFTNLKQWEPFTDKLKVSEVKSIAEILVERGLESLLIYKIEKKGDKIQFEEQEPFTERSSFLQKYVEIFYKTSPEVLKDIRENKLVIFYFPIFPKDLIESVFMNFIFTIVLREESIGLIKKEPIEGDLGKPEYPESQIEMLKRYIETEWRPIFFEHQKKIRERFKENSIKSAIAAIMSRNMSHNIGSHVIADLVANGEMRGPQVQDLNMFFRYLQNRMDFIAQITTEFPEWTYPAYFNKEIMRIFYENYILLDRIGVSEGLRAFEWPEKPEELKESNTEGKIIVRTALNRWTDESALKNQSSPNNTIINWIVHERKIEKLDDDLQLAMPGGIVGYHALYVIIENIIRNSAKHGYAGRQDKNSLEINIRIDNLEDKDYVWVTIWDNIPQLATKNYQKNDDQHNETSGDVLENRQKDERPVPEVEINLFGKLNNYLRKSFIGETGELKKENWGIAELKICAGFLQNRTPAEIGDSGKILIEDLLIENNDQVAGNSVASQRENEAQEQESPEYPTMLIEAIPVDEVGLEKYELKSAMTYFLGYRFWMKKPKTVAIVGKKEESSTCNERKVE